MMLALAFWIGVLMAAAVYRAENDPLFLLILGLTFLSLAPVTVGLVWVYQLPLLFYSDAVSSVVVGVLFLVYRGQVTSRGASTAGTVLEQMSGPNCRAVPDVRLCEDFVCFTPETGRKPRWVITTAFDPKRTFP